MKPYSAYEISQSPFYRLESRGRLAALLRVPPGELRALLRAEDAVLYREQVILKHGRPVLRKDGSPRTAEAPNRSLRPVQERLLDLLNRIRFPEYLHSGVRKRSYVTNAAAHHQQSQTVHLDLRRYYPSTKFHHVFALWRRVFHCSPDVSVALARLCTYRGHLPTGACISGCMAYYAHRELFEQVHREAQDEGVVFGLYGDDLAISGSRGVLRISQILKARLRRRGLDFHEQGYYQGRDTRELTGVVITRCGLRLPNRRHKALIDCFHAWENAPDAATQELKARELMGRLGEASQLDKRIPRLFLNRIRQANARRKSSVSG